MSPLKGSQRDPAEDQNAGESPIQSESLKAAEKAKYKDLFPTRSYRGVPADFHEMILKLADELQVPAGELLYFFANYGYEAYKKGSLKLSLEPRSRRYTLLGKSSRNE